jgi:hypothetical protein
MAQRSPSRQRAMRQPEAAPPSLCSGNRLRIQLSSAAINLAALSLPAAIASARRGCAQSGMARQRQFPLPNLSESSTPNLSDPVRARALSGRREPSPRWRGKSPGRRPRPTEPSAGARPLCGAALHPRVCCSARAACRYCAVLCCAVLCHAMPPHRCSARASRAHNLSGASPTTTALAVRPPSAGTQSPPAWVRQGQPANSRTALVPLAVRRRLAGVCTNGTLLKRASCSCRCCCCCETRLSSSSSSASMACVLASASPSALGTLSRDGRDDHRNECRPQTVISASSSPSINQGLAYARRRIWSACRDGEIAMHTRSVVRRATRRLFPWFPAAARASVA